MVKIRWWGHACFEIGDGKTIVVDPHDGESVGLKPPEAKADVILTTHGHYDHASGVELVAKPGAVKIKGGEKQIGEIKVRGIKSHHDKSSGSQRGENNIYVLEMGGLRICHLGDLGHVPTDAQIQEIGEIDVLLVPVGGVYTVDAGEATETVKLLKPRLVIPMHYKIRGLTVQIGGVDDFLRGKDVKMVNSNQVEISRDRLPSKTEVWVLSYS